MRRFFFSGATALCLTLFGHAASADQLADIKAKGTLVCGTLGTAEPFSFPNPQTREIQGYDVDFCKAIADSLGVKLELRLVAVPARITELQQGRVDILAANLGWTSERAQQIAYSDSYFASLQKVAVRRNSGIKTLDELGGKRVSAIKGSTSEMGVRKAIPTASPVTFQDAPAAFLALQLSKVDGLALSELVLVKYKQQAENTTPIDIVEKPLMLEAWGIGMRKDEAALIEQVNGALRKLDQSNAATAIFDKWLGASSPYGMRREFQIAPIKG
ncbi:ABC transporter substrate-binding protein [Pigmentiphaga aceris]|uniref:ABC transporter substrate-binding protein n=1 Tax=Pigmentiphaga aceris TaxID=1940612 RepID=A0A5C0B2N4_9BURK|nr:ABC transporter substrate-binding protein [Pigmentiphaga aceris]QEI08515.1 ABC transporter substrate-binding protein [Pigmentiphaga aceris]